MKIKFDSQNNVILPDFILATRSGRKLGALPACNITFKNRLNSYSEVFFKVYKYNNGKKCSLWDKIIGLKLVYCPAWNMWYDIEVETEEQNDTVKNITCKSLGVSELSQVMLYNIQINTADDIARDKYVPTVLYDPQNKEGSLLHRITEKIPHYKIEHVDHTIASMQRTFGFDGISLYDAFMEIAKEIKCLFILDCKTNSKNKLERTISVYDLESHCLDCNARGEFIKECSECGSHNVNTGYGNDTSVFVSTENLADNITYSVNAGQVKNCFRLAGGDDLMTAAIQSCNPNGSAYIWQFSKDMREDMSDELNSKITQYDEKYTYYQRDKVYSISGSLLDRYNSIVNKYKSGNEELVAIPKSIKGYPALMTVYYNVLEMGLFLKSVMMPSADINETTAADEVKKLTSSALSPTSVMDIGTASESTVSGAVAAYARAVADNRYQIKVTESSYSNLVWKGRLKVTRYSDEEDTAVTESLTVQINDDYGNFVKQKIDKSLAKKEDKAYGITALFKLGDNAFKNAIKQYGLSSLKMFYDSCQSCLDILTDQGIADKELWAGKKPDLYSEIYLPYFNKLGYLQSEINIRESEIAVVCGTYDKDGLLVEEGVQTQLEKIKNETQKDLEFNGFLGEDLWLEFCSYRREDTYRNDNYISDGLNNAEIFDKALEFIENARKEIYKSAMLQHSISAALKNLLVMKEFAPIVDKFELGNWIRIKSDDKIFRLRIIEFGGDFDNLNTLSVEFSDVLETADGISDWDSILKQTSSLSSSYGDISNQAEAGEQSFKHLNNWVERGLDVTNQRIVAGVDNQVQTWDSHGMLFREHDDITDDYSDLQIKIFNSTLAMTNDNWKTIKTAIGKYYFFDPTDGYKLKVGYGVNAETVIGKMILGEALGIYNESGSMSFDKDGFKVTNDRNTFVVNPNDVSILTISHAGSPMLQFDENGLLHIWGDGSALDINANDSVRGLHSRITQTANEIKLEVSDNVNKLNSRISQTAEDIKLWVGEEDGRLSAEININRNAITQEVIDRSSSDKELSSKITQTAKEITSKVEEEQKRAEGEESRLSSTITQTANSIISKVEEEHKRAAGEEERLSSVITQTATEITSKVEAERKRAEGKEEKLSSSISQTADRITTEVSRIDTNAAEMSSRIDQTANDITLEVKNRKDAVDGEKDRAEKVESSLKIQADSIETKVGKVEKDKDTLEESFSSFKQTYDGFVSKVVTTDKNGSNFIGTEITQNSDYIRLAWNKCSNYIQFENGEMNIYNSSTHSNNSLLTRFNDKGIGFYYQGKYVGKIGTNKMSSDSTSRGLVFDLDGDDDTENNDYMCWASKKRGDSSYMIKFAYYRKDDLLRADCPFEFQSTAKFDSSATFKSSTTFEGSVAFNSEASFKNGIAASNITGHIQRNQLADECIGTSELMDDAVTSSKIADGTIHFGCMNPEYPSKSIFFKNTAGNTVCLTFKNGILWDIEIT